MIKEPKNSNYCASVIQIKTLKPLENVDRVQGAIIFGNQVIVSLDTKVGDIGLYFPTETQLSHEYCHGNNLYRHKNLNSDETKSGYFEDNRRVRCVKFRGNDSEGIFMPIRSLEFTGWGSMEDYEPENFPYIGAEFDEFNGSLICNKYVKKHTRTPGAPGSRKDKKGARKYEDKLVENQFRFHQDTSMLYKNLHKIKPDSLISITYKLHGTSGISSKILHKKELSKWQRLLRFFGADIVESEYKDLCSSRKVIKTPTINPISIDNHFYKEDIWGLAHNDLKEFLQNGMTLYYEIVGYLPSGSAIQKNFDYGYTPKSKDEDSTSYGIYIYRITYTNTVGKVFEFSAKQVQDWCHFNGLNAVPQLFYGYAREFSDERMTEENWEEKFLDTIKERYNDKDCYMCTNTVPEEGCVVRVEKENFEAYKAKSNLFYALETKANDKGENNIEDEN